MDAASGRLTEVFSCGTSSMITPVGRARSAQGEWLMGDGRPGPVTLRLREELTGEPPEGLFAVRCDVTDAGQVERACKEVVREHGPVQVVVANAGITRDRLLARTSEDLAAEEAAYITGPVIPVDGDLGMGH